MQVIKDFLEKYQLADEPIAVGVSGGADSLALVLLLKEACPSRSIVALTVDHKLRPTSQKEANYVAKVMKKFSIEHHILTWDGEKPVNGIEEAARVARYNLLCDWCKKHHIHYLAIAHHLNDQAETFLMRLERGSGLFGLSAMQEISEKNGITILRPLLRVHPDTLKEYLRQKNLQWVEDESNQCQDFLRVRMRQFLPTLKEKTGITAERLCLAAENLYHTRCFIEDTVQHVIHDKVHLFRKCGASFDITEFMSWHDELKFYILSRLICDITGNGYTPEAQMLKGLIEDIKKADFSGSTLGGIYFLKQDLKIWLIKEYRQTDVEMSEPLWKEYERITPEVRGIKIPAKLKYALIIEKKHEK